MKKSNLLVLSMLLVPGSISLSYALDDARTLICKEKVPDCYVTQDKSGCLNITNDKPSKGTVVCKQKGSDKETTYTFEREIQTTTPLTPEQIQDKQTKGQ